MICKYTHGPTVRLNITGWSSAALTIGFASSVAKRFDISRQFGVACLHVSCCVQALRFGIVFNEMSV